MVANVASVDLHQMFIRVNGTNQTEGRDVADTSGGDRMVVVQDVLQLSKGDTVDIQVVTSSTSKNISGASGIYHNFSISRIK